MPTPMPTIATAAVVKSGMSTIVRVEQHERDARADAAQRGEDRQPHREHRAERDEQDDHRGEDPDPLARAARVLVGEHVAAERDARARLGARSLSTTAAASSPAVRTSSSDRSVRFSSA